MKKANTHTKAKSASGPSSPDSSQHRPVSVAAWAMLVVLARNRSSSGNIWPSRRSDKVSFCAGKLECGRACGRACTGSCSVVARSMSVTHGATRKYCTRSGIVRKWLTPSMVYTARLAGDSAKSWQAEKQPHNLLAECVRLMSVVVCSPRKRMWSCLLPLLSTEIENRPSRPLAGTPGPLAGRGADSQCSGKN
jgi:hypothetical protein